MSLPVKENGNKKCKRNPKSKMRVTRVLLKRRLLYINVLKNESAVVAAEEVICQRINTESTNKFKIME